MKILVLKSQKVGEFSLNVKFDSTFRLLEKIIREKQTNARINTKGSPGSLLSNVLYFYTPHVGPDGVLIITERGMEFIDEKKENMRAAKGTYMKINKVSGNVNNILPKYNKSRGTRSFLDDPEVLNVAENLALLGPWTNSTTAQLDGFRGLTCRLPGSSMVTLRSNVVELTKSPEKILDRLLDELYLLMKISKRSAALTSTLLPVPKVPNKISAKKRHPPWKPPKNIQKIFPGYVFSDDVIAWYALLQSGELANYEKGIVVPLLEKIDRHRIAIERGVVRGYEKARRERLSQDNFQKSFEDLGKKQQKVIQKIASLRPAPHDDKWEKISVFMKSLVPGEAGPALETLTKEGYAKQDLRYGLCEHFLELARLIAKKYSPLRVRLELIKMFGMEHWNFFCKICSSRIAVDLHQLTGFDNRASPKDPSDLDRLVYRESRSMVTSHIKFRVPTDPNQLIKSISDTVAPKMDSLETERMKIQANIGDRVVDIITVMTTAYVVTLLAMIVQKNAKTRAVTFITDRGEIVSDDIKVLLNAAHRITMGSRRLLISKMHTVDASVVKKYVLSAYRWAKSLESVREGAPEETKDCMIVDVMQSPAYAYLWRVQNEVRPTKPGNFVKVLGKTLEELQKDKKTSAFREAPSVDPEKLKKQFTSEGWNLYPEYRVEAYENFVRSLHNKVGSLPEGPPPRLGELNRAFSSSENRHRIRYLANGPRLFGAFKLPRLNLSRFYRKNGTLHSWNVWVFVRENGKIGEASASEVPYPVRKFIDQKDPVTGEYLSKVKDYSAEILRALDQKESIAAFFVYFMSRCPEGGLHAFDKNSVCKKCGYSTVFEEITSEISKKKLEYFKKYKGALQKEKENIQKHQNAKKSFPMKKEREEKTEVTGFAKGLILEVSRKMNVSDKLLENLGIINVPYEQFIRRGEKLLVNEDDRCSYGRALILDSYLFEFRCAYRILKSQNTSLLKTINVSYTPFAKVSTKKWPDIPMNNYLPKFRWVMKNLGKEKSVQFAMRHLMQFFLDVHKGVPDLAKTFLKELEQQEIMRTNPEASKIVPEFQKLSYMSENEESDLSGRESSEEILDPLTKQLRDLDVEEGALDEINSD